MRLTPDQAQAIRQRIRSHMGTQARILPIYRIAKSSGVPL